MAKPAARWRGRCFRPWQNGIGRSGHRPEITACEDRRADAGKRFFVRSARPSRHAERKAMITPSHDLPVTRQVKVLGISRGAFYYKARPVPPRDLAIMRRIDELHLERPFAGSRMLRDMLNREGVSVGRRHVAS